MKCKIAICFFLVFSLTVSFAYAGEWVSFKGTSKSGDPFILKGILTKPKGQGPFPAIVMLHGASGIQGIQGSEKHLDIWANRFATWGYVSLLVDSFGPRSKSDISGDPLVISAQKRSQDAHDAKSYLNELSFVNRNQIAISGWSHGGWTVLHAIDDATFIKNRRDPFRAAIAFYPHCDIPLRNLNAPLLILIGELDDWLPAAMCRLWMPSGNTTPETILKVYPEAYHGFDIEGIDISKHGHRILYNRAAAEDAIEQVENFLAKYLK